jgi:hypothetical protein
MGLLNRIKGTAQFDGVKDGGASNNAGRTTASPDMEKGSHEPVRLITPRVIFMGVIVSMGGFIFGYDTGKQTFHL